MSSKYSIAGVVFKFFNVGLVIYVLLYNLAKSHCGYYLNPTGAEILHVDNFKFP